MHGASARLRCDFFIARYDPRRTFQLAIDQQPQFADRDSATGVGEP